MNAYNRMALVLWIVAIAPASAATVHAQTAVDTLHLSGLQDAAVRADPRATQLDLLSLQSELRLRSLDAERLPALSVLGQAQYQSDVASIPFELPGGGAPPGPPRDTYDAHLAARQRLYDREIGARRDVERAQLAESQARLRSSLYALRQQVNDAYFNALLLQSRAAELATAITSLEAQLRVAVQRVTEGAALPGDAAMLEAEVLRRRQSLDELRTGEAAARVVLEDLTGRGIEDADVLALPDLGEDVAEARAVLDELRARPEYEQFARTRDVLERRQRSVSAQTAPRVSAYGRAGYGRPGLNPLGNAFDTYWVTGVQVEWTPWTWGTTEREREVLALQQRIVTSEENAFTDELERSAIAILATVDRLERALRSDAEIIALREQILRETEFRFAESVVTSAEYVDRESDLLEARLIRAVHRVELAQARARFLTLAGVEIR